MKNLIIVIVLAINFIPLNYASGKEQPKFLQGVEFLTGFGRGELIFKQDYHVVPFIIDFDFNIKSLTKYIGFNPPNLVQFQIEPFLSLTTKPETNMEVGTSFLLKLGLVPEGWKFQPYLKGGVGMIYMTQHTLEQSTQFNFIPNGGGGLHYFFKKDTALTIEYRFRHLSNSSIKQPNGGIDTHLGLFGITHLF